MTDGIERVIAKAAADGRFRERLLSDREGALRRARLTDSERAILIGIPDEQLATIVANAPAQTAPRRGFIGRAIVYGALLLGGGAVAGTMCQTFGNRPDRPPPKGEAPDVPPPTEDDDSPDNGTTPESVPPAEERSDR